MRCDERVRMPGPNSRPSTCSAGLAEEPGATLNLRVPDKVDLCG
jgi:hypothetical protein